MLSSDLTSRVITVGPAFEPPRGGIAQVLANYKAEVFAAPFQFIEETDPQRSLPYKCWRLVTSAAQLYWKLLRNKHLRIVHIHTSYGISFRRAANYVAIAKALGRRTVVHVHGSMFESYSLGHRKLVDKVFGSTDAIIALSEWWRDFFVDKLGADRYKITVLPNIMATPRMESLPYRDGDPVKALFMGELGPRKGFFDLLDAMAMSRRKLEGRLKLLVGGGGDVDGFKQKVKDLQLDDMVDFRGWVLADDKARMLAEAQLIVLPSYNEGLPIFILEGMAQGLPVVSTTVGGIPEVVDDQNGALITPGDKQALADALCRLSADAELRKRMGQVSRQRALPYMPPQVSQHLDTLYRSLLAK